MSSPTQRSKALMESRGYRVGIVERRKGPVTVDLFGIGDLFGIRDEEPKLLLVQTTSGAHVAARIRKIEQAEALRDVRDAGIAIHVHGWRKNAKGRWVCREVDCS